jgi:plastocyanin
MRIPLALTGLAAIALIGCSSSDSPGPGPSPGVATITLAAASTDPMVSFGETRTVTATARDANGGSVASPSLTWSSSAPAVATVTGTGASATITSVGNGTATISASSGSVAGTVSVAVAQRTSALAITNAPASLVPGATVQLVSEARDARQRAVTGVSGFTYASSDPGVAAVSATGLVTAIAPGSATLTSAVTASGVAVTGTVPLRVDFATANPSSASVNTTNGDQFTPSTVTIAPGGSVTWTFGSTVHNVGFSAANAPANIPDVSNSQVSRTFATAGTFPYACSLHVGMNGTVVVQGATNAPSYTALLNGRNERPVEVVTTGTGAAALTVNGGTVSYVVTFSGLTGAPIMSHIHGPGAATQAVGVLVDFPTAGQTSNTGVLTGTFTAANIRGQGGQPPISMDSLLTLLRTRNAYVNVHTTQYPGGEIRGQTVPR